MFCHMLKLKDVKNANIESLKNASIHGRSINRESWNVTGIVNFESFEGKFVSLEELGRKIRSLTNVIKLILLQ